MSHQCEARTTSRRRCRCEGREYRRVAYSDGVREYLVCRTHYEAIVQGAFRPAVDKPVIERLPQPVLRAPLPEPGAMESVSATGGRVSG